MWTAIKYREINPGRTSAGKCKHALTAASRVASSSTMTEGAQIVFSMLSVAFSWVPEVEDIPNKSYRSLYLAPVMHWLRRSMCAVLG